MSLCLACGHLSADDREESLCPACSALYRREVEQEGKYPPGLTEEGKKEFTEVRWGRLKALERRLRSGSVSPEEAREEMGKMVRYLNGARAMREEAARKREALARQKLY